MKKILLAIFATCFIVSLSAQESALQQNDDLIAVSAEESTHEQDKEAEASIVSKKTVIKSAKIAGLATIALATGYLLCKSRAVTHYVIPKMNNEVYKWNKNGYSQVLQDAYNDTKLHKDVLASAVAAYASYCAIEKIIKIAKS